MRDKIVAFFILLCVIFLVFALSYVSEESPEKIEEREARRLKEPAEFLFEKDGVRVYKFYDNGNAVYFSDSREVKILK